MKWYELKVVVVGYVAAVALGGLTMMVNHHLVKSASLGPLTDPCAGQIGQTCYDDYFNNIIKTKGPGAALDRVSALAAKYPGFEAECHPIVHTIGHNAFSFYKDVTKAMEVSSAQSEICASGYIHGVMEIYMAGFDDAKLLAQMPHICKPTPGKPYSSDYFSCIHGLGHGVTIRFNMDIFKALPYCEVLPDDWHKQSCYGGVFMQNIVADLQPQFHKSVDLRPDDPIYPCNAVPVIQKPQCYGMVSSYILRTNGWDYAKAFVTCQQSDPGFVGTCYESMGRDISGAALLDPQKVIAACSQGDPDLASHCYIGASKNAVYNDHATARADALCDEVSVRYKSDCLSARNEIARSL